jgi:Uncharacterized protein conserved in bacteria
MAIEIERKFLVSGDAWKAQAHAVIEMAQGYLNPVDAIKAGGQKASVRVRLEGESARLNIKSCEPGHTRQEFEYPLPVADARQLLALCVGGWCTSAGIWCRSACTCGKWTSSSVTTPALWWPKSSSTRPTRCSSSRTGPLPKSPTSLVTTTLPWPTTPTAAGAAASAVEPCPLRLHWRSP